MAFSTTEITSSQIVSDNPVHQRLFFAYHEAGKIVHGNLLEIGCGVGRGLDVLASSCERYTGIDKNEELLKVLQRDYPQLNFIYQHIPPFTGIADNTFDYIVTFQVIEHIENDDLFIKEIYRVLKPGGKAIITTPNIKLSLTRNPWHIREYTAAGLHTLIQKYFRKVDKQGVHGNAKVMEYYSKNKKAVEKITRFDIFNLQYRLPRAILQVPYDFLNRLNRKSLMNSNDSLVNEISYEDYFLSRDVDNCLDFFYIAEK
ncbi:class I SAM-dependent methyltransferase [Rhodocytophaga aerolata]|uniref:Class I SAM-dependent methyltransferase n=1 Tax=Rhodocytophaga aerolata TaxID=455078 RepID=A0ABT8R2J2_9BACT|nr:class I SAM-dependent methyltransferase [Rhodocytophaga aerolata]MDO1446310.1 class I SAM-dependent methyltransferase [Rhodocytophaga aerolata]